MDVLVNDAPRWRRTHDPPTFQFRNRRIWEGFVQRRRIIMVCYIVCGVCARVERAICFCRADAFHLVRSIPTQCRNTNTNAIVRAALRADHVIDLRSCPKDDFIALSLAIGVRSKDEPLISSVRSGTADYLSLVLEHIWSFGHRAAWLWKA